MSDVNPSSTLFPDVWTYCVQRVYFQTMLLSFRENIFLFPHMLAEQKPLFTTLSSTGECCHTKKGVDLSRQRIRTLVKKLLKAHYRFSLVSSLGVKLFPRRD